MNRKSKHEGWVEAVRADTHRERSHDGYRYAQPILHLLQTLAVVLTGFGMATALPAIAQAYPSKPIRVIVPFPPGGA